jgi:hypothetical protein
MAMQVLTDTGRPQPVQLVFSTVTIALLLLCRLVVLTAVDGGVLGDIVPFDHAIHLGALREPFYWIDCPETLSYCLSNGAIQLVYTAPYWAFQTLGLLAVNCALVGVIIAYAARLMTARELVVFIGSHFLLLVVFISSINRELLLTAATIAFIFHWLRCTQLWPSRRGLTLHLISALIATAVMTSARPAYGVIAVWATLVLTLAPKVRHLTAIRMALLALPFFVVGASSQFRLENIARLKSAFRESGSAVGKYFLECNQILVCDVSRTSYNMVMNLFGGILSPLKNGMGFPFSFNNLGYTALAIGLVSALSVTAALKFRGFKLAKLPPTFVLGVYLTVWISFSSYVWSPRYILPFTFLLFLTMSHSRRVSGRPSFFRAAPNAANDTTESQIPARMGQE